METFIKKYIKSEDDLPKEADAYFVGKKYDTGFVKTTVLDAENYNPLDNNWLKEVNYYIDSCPELVELINIQMELLNAYRHGREHPVKWWNEKYDRIAQLRKEVGI